jgi:hypothetical protein
MIKPQLKLVALLLAVAPWAVPASAQSTHFSLGIGYDWLTLSGSEDMYKSQFNQGQGFGLQDLSLTTTDPSGSVFDRLSLDAAGFGADPEGRFRLEVGRSKVYDLRISYLRARYFSALPGLANPFLAQGVVPGEHTQDRVSQNLDVDLELLPGGTVTPLLGYSRYHVDGPGTTTYHVGQDEFRLNSSLDETTHETRAGVGLHFNDFQATILEAWRSFDELDTYSLAAGAGNGNNPGPVLGENQTLSSLNRRDRSEGSYAVTTGSFAGTVSDRIRVSGSFVKTDFQSSLSEDEALSGNLVSFELARFFTGLNQTSGTHASVPDWRGTARIETTPIDGFEASGGFTRSHRDFDGSAFISSLYTGTVNYAGLDPRDITTLLTSSTAMERDETTWDAKLSSRNLGPVRLWADVAVVDQQLTVTPDAAEIVVPGGEGGTFDRTLNRWSAGANLDVSSVKFALDWKEDNANHTIVRTDFRDLKRWRLRADWKAAKFLHVLGTAERIDGDNPAVGANYTLGTRHYGADVDVMPIEALDVRLGYGRYKTDTAITIRVPQDFTLAPSLFSEDGEEKDASASLKLGGVLLEAGFSRFDNTGDLGLRLDRTFAHCDLDFTSNLGASLRFDRYKYNEDVLAVSDFEAKRYGVFLRWHE